MSRRGSACTTNGAHSPLPAGRGEGSGDLVVDGARRQPRVRGCFRRSLIRRDPLTLALRARCRPGEGSAALSPPAGRGGTRAPCGSGRFARLYSL
ncbi:hypothetical protein F1D61_17915 [Methylobacterium aquaticum]|nr:hypothetical protein F1D61_17915 [Methylobacterium aquaticum]